MAYMFDPPHDDFILPIVNDLAEIIGGHGVSSFNDPIGYQIGSVYEIGYIHPVITVLDLLRGSIRIEYRAGTKLHFSDLRDTVSRHAPWANVTFRQQVPLWMARRIRDGVIRITHQSRLTGSMAMFSLKDCSTSPLVDDPENAMTTIQRRYSVVSFINPFAKKYYNRDLILYLIREVPNAMRFNPDLNGGMADYTHPDADFLNRFMKEAGILGQSPDKSVLSEVSFYR